MKRAHLSETKRAELFRDLGGICHLCEGKIGVGEAWDISHEIPLELGGADDDTNRKLAHRKCHRRHTAEKDTPAIAKAKRRERRHMGIKPRTKFKGWRRMNGDLVWASDRK